MAGATADPMVVPSDTGCADCGTCTSSIFGALPSIFQGAGQAVAQITAANNQTDVAKLKAQTDLSLASIQANTQTKIAMEILLAVGIIGLVWLGTRSSSK